MAVPKLPLIVPKAALSAKSNLVPKLAPKITPELLKKSPLLAKAVHTGVNLPPKKPLNDNSETNQPNKLTKLVSNSNLVTKKLNSKEESPNDVDFTQEDLNNTEVEVVPVQVFNSHTNNTRSSNNNLLHSQSRTSNRSFHEDLASRVNRSSILSDLSVGHSTKSLSKSFSNDYETQNKFDKTSKTLSRESNPFSEDKNLNNQKTENNTNDVDLSDERDDVGYTPWLKIEKRINEIRSLASKDQNNKNTPNKTKNVPNLYNNYNTQYQENGWKKELTHPLSYGIVQKLTDKKQFELPKDNWKFINGFIKPRRKPFTSMSEMSKYFQKVDTKDQYDLIKLLLACRDLEKVIEEQHTVLDMLDHDLREARDLFPDSLNNVTTQKLFGSTPDEDPFYPSSDVPLFLKGRVFLLPKNGKNTPKGNK